jgi:hypothetical protein
VAAVTRLRDQPFDDVCADALLAPRREGVDESELAELPYVDG